jgi:dinuclear metal center YbgI/SA1388 family protein
MVRLKNIIDVLNEWAPPGLQEAYDNSGLIAGNPDQQITGALICIDVTEAVVDEAIRLKYNLIISHHPPVFTGLKRFTGASLSERVLMLSVKHDVALFAIHTNLDSVSGGVSGLLAGKLGLINTSILVPRSGQLRKLVCFIPPDYAGRVADAVFKAGAGSIGKYDECSFQGQGSGTFRAGPGTNPFLGIPGEPSREAEIRFETVVPEHLAGSVVRAMKEAHPYEEAAYDLYPLINENPVLGFGILGELPTPENADAFLTRVKSVLGLPLIRHSKFTGTGIHRVAVCGGSGSSFISRAVKEGCDCYLTADIKYHDWFDVPETLMLADIGHYESEQFAMIGICDSLNEKLPKFAVRLTEVNTNPINYF